MHGIIRIKSIDGLESIYLIIRKLRVDENGCCCIRIVFDSSHSHAKQKLRRCVINLNGLIPSINIILYSIIYLSKNINCFVYTYGNVWIGNFAHRAASNRIRIHIQWRRCELDSVQRYVRNNWDVRKICVLFFTNSENRFVVWSW